MAPPLLSSFLFFLTCFFFNVHSSTASPIHYKGHCASIVPEANVRYYRSRFISVDHHLQTAYFTGADRFLGANPYSQKNSIFLRLGRFRETDVAGLFKVRGSISITSISPYYHVGNFSYGRSSYYRRRRSSVTIMLDGFWSESTGKICMVGSGSDYSRRGKTLDIDVVLKLSNVFSSSNISSLVSGSLDRLKRGRFDFETYPVLMIPRFNYEFTLDSAESKNEFSHVGMDGDGEKGLPENNIDMKFFCSSRVWASIRQLNLEYSGDCNTQENCTPFSGIPGFLPPSISLTLIECTFTKKKQLRILINFGNHSYEDYGANVFNPKTTLVGEGWWDEKKNHLNVVACHFLGLPSSSFSSVHVGDCSVRLKLRFPSIWSIKDTSTVVGQIWSNKTVKDPDFFKGVTFRNEDDQNVNVQALEYEYTQQDTVKSLCPRPNVSNKGRRYPNPYSYNMQFDMSVRDSIRKVAQGNSAPLSVGDQFYDLVLSTKSATGNFITSGLFNISYKIRMSLSDNGTLRDKKSLFSMYNEAVTISAEGVYDAGAGSLCMVGCRILPPSNNVIPMSRSVDCEILVKFRFPPLHLRSAGYIVGSIESTRNKSDPLHFNSLGLSSAAIYKEVARETVERMDMEIIMVLISATVHCVLVGFQLCHVKKNPQVLPFISLTMLSILTLSHMIPLVLNFEALISQNHNAKNFVLSSVAWLESNEIIVRLITMVAFLMQFRLLQLTWSARNSTDDVTQDSLWIAEKEAMYVTLPSYAVGFLIAMLKGKGKNNHYLAAASSNYQQTSSWEVLKSYGGLVNDGFLLPQILMNMLSNMKKDALCGIFYLGTSFLRILPHVYDLYRTSQYDRQYSGSYLYADPSADFYSTAWDLAIIVGCHLFVLVIYLQQRFGGSFILPSRFRGSDTYEMVPTGTQEAEEVEVEEGTPKI
ncbi:uncharacterized protein LOC114739193 [Neltuma alba]|uniref:uncharacterized protein LOC114736282 n=1 Tax=Neltuma alba TaxID=207710 RepID=UPI0010A48EA3|nr:uncharacterized protein LOC114736282 [Prosopis alba]XP_028783077.1 uncharacterized protein LOC114739193 [Prosopis alba]